MNYNLLKYKAKNFFSIPLLKILKKINGKIKTKIRDSITEKKDLEKKMHIESSSISLYSYINYKKENINKIDLNLANYLCNKYISHYFNLLGSGYIKINYNINIHGIEDIKYEMSPKIGDFDIEGNWLAKTLLPSHVNYAKKIWQKVGEDYTPIDWQMDYKSGFRFSQKVWYKKQPIGKFKGADIKYPWELSRMQHLPQLAAFSKIFMDKKDIIINEFKNEIYDFAATNPLRMGANWACTMDVGIRAANILIAHDILKGNDDKNILDESFEKFLGNFIYEHGDFIVHNLEWNYGDNNNHYLSGICGLLFISAYLERNEVTDSWLTFSIQELIDCMDKQFHNDGSNFEASTSYHRLSGELFIYSTALVYGILKTDKREALRNYNYKLIKRLKSREKQKFNLNDDLFFPEWYIDRLFKAGCFTVDITKPNGEIPQIGDNDSGRFFKFSPIGSLITSDEAERKYINLKGLREKCVDTNLYFDENVLDHSTFISSLNGLFDYDGFEQFSSKCPLEKSIVECLSKGFKIKKNYEVNKISIADKDISKLKYSRTTEIKYEKYAVGKINTGDIKLIAYSDFGMYIFKGSEFYLSIFAGGIGQNGIGGHSHNDKLSFELNLRGKDIFVDPGTYVYTSLPERRDLFRSVKVHNVPIVNNEEQNNFISLFSVENETKCYILDYKNNYIKLYLTYRDIQVIREFNIHEDSLIINDSCNKKFYVNLNDSSVYSNGYGKLIALSNKSGLVPTHL